MTQDEHRRAISRRRFLQGAGAAAGAFVLSGVMSRWEPIGSLVRSHRQVADTVKVGVLLPTSTINPGLGRSVLNGMKLAFEHHGNVAGYTLNVAAPGVLDNDTDPENDTLTASLKSVPLRGTVPLNGDDSFAYSPNAGFTGVDTFDCMANDGQNDSNEATVTVRIQGVEGICGDQDGDGDVTLLDAILDMLFIVGALQPTAKQLVLSNLDGDTDITVLDVIMLLQQLVGARPNISCGPTSP